MTRLTSLDLTPFYRNAVGFDSLFDRITSNIDMATSNGAGNYPPYDIIRTGEETYRIQLAVAGFQLADIKIELNNGTLSITGHQQLPLWFYIHDGRTRGSCAALLACSESPTQK